MPPPILFASDVHLRPNDPVWNRCFLDFLEQDAEAIYLIGDLFDYWIGSPHLDLPDYRAEIAAIRRRARSTPIGFIKGNRDYMVDRRFERALGVRILGDEAWIDVGGRRVALAHGDFIYNVNSKYTAYRRLMKAKPVEALVGQIPALAKVSLARIFRQVSVRTTPSHAWTESELLDRAEAWFRRGADVLIAGHIHQPAHVRRRGDGRERELFVLGDWCGGTQDYVAWESGEFRLKRWPR
jgi:UDP-2,3-diacylglucosamine hydrolase